MSTSRYRARLSLLVVPLLVATAAVVISPSATAAPITLSASADAYVNYAKPTRNYGSAQQLRVDAGPTVFSSYVRFDLPASLTSIGRATLRVRLLSDALAGVRVSTVDPSRWQEATITAGNAPPALATVGTSARANRDAWVTIDVTSVIAAGRPVSFLLRDPITTAVAMSSRESGSAPQLTIEAGATTSSGAITTAPTTTLASPGTTNATATIRAAFYYPWFPEAWSQQGINPFSYYQPTLGYYSNDDRSVLAAHVAMMRYANLNTAIASWWGQGTKTDGRVRALLDASGTTGFKWTLYYEPEGTSDPTVSQIRADLDYIRSQYAGHPAFLTRGGKPVIFVYGGPTDDCGMADRWAQANSARNFQIVLKVFVGYRTCASQPDLWHQYAPAVAADSQAGYSYSISPGFYLRTETSPRLPRDITRFAQSATAMVASNAPLQLVTTFNEWGEGTSVEPATAWTSSSGMGSYLDVLHAVLPASVYADSRPPVTTTTTSPATTTTAGSTTTTTRPTTTTTAGSTTTTTRPTTTTTTSTTIRPPTGGDPVIAAAGDIACDPTSGSFNGGAGTATECRQAATAKLLDPTRHSAVLTLGDNQYENGALDKYLVSYGPSWGALKAITKPAPGNHEYLTAGATGYYQYFGAAAGDPAKGYYSWDVGAWHMVVVNSNCSSAGGCGRGSPQETWLRADLAAHPTACTMAYWHHPRFSSGEHGDNASMTAIWQALIDGGADVVLSGHDHDYERFAPMLADGTIDTARGMRQFVVGTGGKNSYVFNAPRAGSEVRATGLAGVIELTLHASSYDWRFLPASGSTFTDQGTQTCH